jgi:predicted DNA-binding transcriptional regulator AlpA
MTKQTDDSPDFRVLTETEAAKVLGISPRSLQQYRLDGKGPPYIQIMDRRIGYDREEVKAWAKARTRRSTSDKGKAA